MRKFAFLAIIMFIHANVYAADVPATSKEAGSKAPQKSGTKSVAVKKTGLAPSLATLEKEAVKTEPRKLDLQQIKRTTAAQPVNRLQMDQINKPKVILKERQAVVIPKAVKIPPTIKPIKAVPMPKPIMVPPTVKVPKASAVSAKSAESKTSAKQKESKKGD